MLNRPTKKLTAAQKRNQLENSASQLRCRARDLRESYALGYSGIPEFARANIPSIVEDVLCTEEKLRNLERKLKEIK